MPKTPGAHTDAHSRERSEVLSLKVRPETMRRLKEEAAREKIPMAAVVESALDWWWLTGSRYTSEVTREVVTRAMKSMRSALFRASRVHARPEERGAM
jgi:hypothetical protein